MFDDGPPFTLVIFISLMILSIYKQGARSADTHLPTLSAIEFIVHLFGMLVSDDTFDAIGNGADGGCSPTTI